MRYLLAGAVVGTMCLGATACSQGDEGSGDKGGADIDSGGSNVDGGSNIGAGTGGATSDGNDDMPTGCNETLCGSECVDMQTDAVHCGACGTSCSEFEACQQGACIQVSCESDLTLCSGECFDVTTDVEHCGSCVDQCSLSYTCSDSSCACPAERTECDGFCTETDFDRQNCGGCASSGGATCSGEEACVSGKCQVVAIPQDSYCDATKTWESGSIALEFEILDIVNQRRAEGATCGEKGYFPPAGPLQMDASLRCAARVHSLDMATRDFFSHQNPEDEGPSVRMDAAGYMGKGWGENISAGRSSAEKTMEGWMKSDGHCSNIMNSGYTLIGVGYAPSTTAQYKHYWTQTFGR